MSIDGNVALVGALGDDDNGYRSGAAYIYRWDGSQWQEESKLLASVGAREDDFGNSVSINGNVALVGARYDDDNGGNSGSAYLYDLSFLEDAPDITVSPASISVALDEGQSSSETLVISNTGTLSLTWAINASAAWLDVSPTSGTVAPEGAASVSVGIDASGLSAGAYTDTLTITSNDPSEPSVGVPVSLVVGSRNITELKLTASDGAQHDYFGRAVSIDGDVMLVGAHYDDDNGTQSGSAYIYRWDGSQWVEEAKLTASDGAPYDYFGFQVSIDGDVALVGAYGDDDNGTYSGSAYIYRWDGSQWQEESKLLASGASRDFFGYSVSIDGNVALVGARGDDDNGQNSGAAYIYRWDGSQWQEESKLLASVGASGDYFGYSVSIDGDVALVGALSDNGSAYIYRWDGSQWQEESKLLASVGASRDAFGRSVSISRDVALVGAVGDDDNGTYSGSAYIYRWDGSQWQEESKLLPSDGAPYQHQFGYSVSIDGDVALVGALGDDDNGYRSGSAYIYRWDGSQWQEENKLLANDGAESDEFGYSVSIKALQEFVLKVTLLPLVLVKNLNLSFVILIHLFFWGA